MTRFENNALRELANMKAHELALTETEKGENLADELKGLMNRIYAFQSKETADKTVV